MDGIRVSLPFSKSSPTDGDGTGGLSRLELAAEE